MRRRVSRKRRVRCANGDVRVPPGVRGNPVRRRVRRVRRRARTMRALTNASAASWSDADEAYEIVETTCECSDEYMGANCTIPCPCAPGAFGRGACVVDSLEAAGAYGDVTDEELGECACDPGWVGEDCSVPCPACVANQGDCAPPPGFEKGVGRALADVDADVTHVSEAARRRRWTRFAWREYARVARRKQTIWGGRDTRGRIVPCRARRARLERARRTARARARRGSSETRATSSVPGTACWCSPNSTPRTTSPRSTHSRAFRGTRGWRRAV